VPSLETCYLRIDRASKRIEELARQVAAYVEANKSIAIKVHGLTVSVVGWPDQPSPDMGVTAGEVVYNLRAALDYLVFELAILGSGEVNMRTQFPIEDKPEGFKARRHPDKRGRPNWLTGVDCAHCAALEALQPYNGVNWTEFLRDMSNEDKHRTIPLLGYASPPKTINVGGTEEEAKTFGGYRMPGDDVSMYYPSTIHVTLNSDPPVPVVETLQILQSEVRAVIDSFEPDFEGAWQEPLPLSPEGIVPT
jgi:hypothetical protein